MQLSIFQNPESDVSKHVKPKIKNYKLYVDGASRNNPGPSGAGIYIIADDKEMVKEGFYLGTKTNNQAEYLALLIGLCLYSEYVSDTTHLHIFSDSQLLVRQLQGIYKVKDQNLLPLFTAAKKMLLKMHYTASHILREHNAIADLCANKGIDTKKRVPDHVKTILSEYSITI